MIPLPSLSGALGLGLIASLALAGIQTIRMDNAKADAAETKVKFADFKTSIAEQNLKLVQDQQKREAAAFEKLTTAMQTLGSIGQKTQTEVRLVQSNGAACKEDPAYLAMLDGVERVRLVAAQGSSSSNQGQSGPKTPVPLHPAGTPKPK